MVKVNGTEREISGKTVTEMLEQEHFDTGRVVVELNLEILPKTEYSTTLLRDGDSVEVVSFVGGG